MPCLDGVSTNAALRGKILATSRREVHWAVSVPIGRTRPKVAKRYVDHNDYPREAMFEAILRFVEEDLDSRINRVD
jgi:hypothetical protein